MQSLVLARGASNILSRLSRISVVTTTNKVKSNDGKQSTSTGSSYKKWLRKKSFKMTQERAGLDLVT